jgi:hypothetical protein
MNEFLRRGRWESIQGGAAGAGGEGDAADASREGAAGRSYPRRRRG